MKSSLSFCIQFENAQIHTHTHLLADCSFYEYSSHIVKWVVNLARVRAWMELTILETVWYCQGLKNRETRLVFFFWLIILARNHNEFDKLTPTHFNTYISIEYFLLFIEFSDCETLLLCIHACSSLSCYDFDWITAIFLMLFDFSYELVQKNLFINSLCLW